LNTLAWNNKMALIHILLVLRVKEWLIGIVGGISTLESEVKFLDFRETNFCESI
jgi:hypothetical protein